ncbi:hypothetical protein BDM02DRAFT_3105147, partial [Thelephora ganbajun]
CPPEWVTWIQDSFIVPSCLVPHGGNDLLPDGTQSISLRLFGLEKGLIAALFQDDSHSTVTHDLLCVGGTDAGKYWFMTAAEDWPEVTEHLQVRDGLNTIHIHSMSPQELLQVPFNIYFYMQRKGDLVILPPRRSGHQRSLCAQLNCLSSLSQTIH